MKSYGFYAIFIGTEYSDILIIQTKPTADSWIKIQVTVENKTFSFTFQRLSKCMIYLLVKIQYKKIIWLYHMFSLGTIPGNFSLIFYSLINDWFILHTQNASYFIYLIDCILISPWTLSVVALPNCVVQAVVGDCQVVVYGGSHTWCCCPLQNRFLDMSTTTI